MDPKTTQQRDAFFHLLNSNPNFVKTVASQMNTFTQDEFEVPADVTRATEALDCVPTVAAR